MFAFLFFIRWSIILPGNLALPFSILVHVKTGDITINHIMEVWGDDEKSEEHAAPSPLRPLRKSLTVLRFIGFPLRFSDDSDDELRNKRWFGAVIFVQGSVSLNSTVWASGLQLGWVDLDLGSSPGWWAASVATYCPSRMVEHP